jgi:ribosomal protein S18 acetylase RimI-like enzyme
VPNVRSATLDDVDAVVDLWNRAAGPTRHAGQVAEAAQLLRRDPDALLVADDGGRIVGTLIVGWDGWRCHMYRLAVDPVVRRAGIANALVAKARDLAVAHGASRLDAMVNADNTGAVALWERAGFELDTDDRRWSLLL